MYIHSIFLSFNRRILSIIQRLLSSLIFPSSSFHFILNFFFISFFLFLFFRVRLFMAFRTKKKGGFVSLRSGFLCYVRYITIKEKERKKKSCFLFAHDCIFPCTIFLSFSFVYCEGKKDDTHTSHHAAPHSRFSSPLLVLYRSSVFHSFFSSSPSQQKKNSLLCSFHFPSSFFFFHFGYLL